MTRFVTVTFLHILYFDDSHNSRNSGHNLSHTGKRGTNKPTERHLYIANRTRPMSRNFGGGDNPLIVT